MSVHIPDPTDYDRDVATRRVVKAFSRLKMRGQLDLAVRTEEGATPICVVLPGDIVGHVSDRVTAMGGAANVVIAYPDSFSILSWVGDVQDGPDDVDVAEQINMSMFLAYLRTCDGEATMNVRRGARESVQVPEMAYPF